MPSSRSRCARRVCTAFLIMCHCETSSQTGRGNPFSLAPLPKGGWHGEAVTGGFLSRASCYVPVGATLAVARPDSYRISYNVSLRSQCAHWLWQSAFPAPSAPLPKGDWHGEAVTGGFFFRTPCNVSLRRRPHTAGGNPFFNMQTDSSHPDRPARRRWR